MVHRFDTLRSLCQFGYGNPGLLGGSLPLVRGDGEGDRLFGEADLRADSAQTEEMKDVWHQNHIVSPVADIVGDRRRAVSFAKVIADMRRGHGSPGSAGLRQEAAAEFQHTAAVGGRSLGEEDYGQAGVERGLQSRARLEGGTAVSTGYVYRACHGRHPAEQRILGDFGLGDEDARVKRSEDDDVEVAEVIGDHGAALRKSSRRLDLDSHSVES